MDSSRWEFLFVSYIWFFEGIKWGFYLNWKIVIKVGDDEGGGEEEEGEEKKKRKRRGRGERGGGEKGIC